MRTHAPPVGAHVTAMFHADIEGAFTRASRSHVTKERAQRCEAGARASARRARALPPRPCFNCLRAFCVRVQFHAHACFLRAPDVDSCYADATTPLCDAFDEDRCDAAPRYDAPPPAQCMIVARATRA